MHTSAEVANHGKAATSVSVKATITDGVTGASVGTSTSASVSIPPCSGSGPCATVMVNSSAAIKNAKLWSVKSPSLYTVTVDVVEKSGKLLDTTNYSVGVRTMVYSDKGLSLNNEPVKVRGFCDHSNFAGVGGAVPDRVNLYRVQMLRSVGGNAWCGQLTSPPRKSTQPVPPLILCISWNDKHVHQAIEWMIAFVRRMAHNPPIPARLDFMDRLGMLALDENRDYVRQLKL